VIVSPNYRNYRKHAGVLRPVAIFIFMLTLVLIIGSTALIIYNETIHYQVAIHYEVALEAQLTHTAVKVTQTILALSTAQANINATATAQVHQRASATAAIKNEIATAKALNDLYTQATNGKPIFDDPLKNSTGPGNWDQGSSAPKTGCSFATQGYHVTEARQGYLQPCLAQATRFRSFIYQVRMTINNGEHGEAGLLFCIDNTNRSYYFFHISPDGTYALDLSIFNPNHQPNTWEQNLAWGTSGAIAMGLGQSNQIAVIANSNALYLYVNGHYLTTAQDSALSTGKIGLGAVDTKTPIDTQFTDAQVWQLQSPNTEPPR
jgi:hypothetical protein